MIKASIPYFTEEDIEYIQEKFSGILRDGGYLSTGQYTEAFEREFADYIGTKYAIACNSGTSALEIIFRSLDLSDKEVIIPSNTFIATANAVMNSGAIPVFADCNAGLGLSFDDVVSKVGPRTGAICNVHIGGIISSEVIKISNYCKENNIYFVEDAAQAHGSYDENEKAGNFGVAAGFSFFSTKVMTTGEGGMITTNEEEIYRKAKSLREFGKQPNEIYTNIYERFGYNWRMPEVSSIIGLRQLKNLNLMIVKRKRIAEKYDSLLENNKNFIIHNGAKFFKGQNHYKYIIILNDGVNRDMLHLEFKKRGIQPSGYIYELPLHSMKIFEFIKSTNLPKTDSFCLRHFCLPIHPNLKDHEIEYISRSLIEITNKFGV